MCRLDGDLPTYSLRSVFDSDSARPAGTGTPQQPLGAGEELEGAPQQPADEETPADILQHPSPCFWKAGSALLAPQQPPDSSEAAEVKAQF